MENTDYKLYILKCLILSIGVANTNLKLIYMVSILGVQCLAKSELQCTFSNRHYLAVSTDLFTTLKLIYEVSRYKEQKQFWQSQKYLQLFLKTQCLSGSQSYH